MHGACQRHFLTSPRKSVAECAIVWMHFAVGVQLRRGICQVHVDFLPVMLAVSRLGYAFVLMSSDLPDKKLETARTDPVTW